MKDERGPGSVNWSARVRAAIEHGKVPAGKQLSTRWIEGEIEIRLEDLAPGLDPRLVEVPVLERVARYHPVVKRFREDSEHLEVSRAQLGRASRILQALVTAAEDRGWEGPGGRGRPRVVSTWPRRVDRGEQWAHRGCG